MAKKPMTKSQIVSHFAGKFELTKKTASGIIEEVAELGSLRDQEDRLLYHSWDRETGPGEKESSHGSQSGYW